FRFGAAWLRLGPFGRYYQQAVRKWTVRELLWRDRRPAPRVSRRQGGVRDERHRRRLGATQPLGLAARSTRWRAHRPPRGPPSLVRPLQPALLDERVLRPDGCVPRQPQP